MIYRLLTNNNPLNLIVLTVFALIFYFFNVDFSQSVFLISFDLVLFFAIIFLLQRIAVFMEFKPGQDFLPIYFFLFFSSISFFDFNTTVSLFFAVLGLFFMLSIIANNIKPKPIDIAQISLYFALSGVFNKYFFIFSVLIILAIIFYYPGFKNLLIVIVVYIAVLYLIFAYFFLLKHYPLTKIFSLLRIGHIKLAIFKNQTLYWLTEGIFLFFSYIFLLVNFFKFPIRLRKDFVIMSLFFIMSILITPFIKNASLQAISASYLISFFFINFRIKTWLKDLSLLLIVLVNLLILFQFI